MVCHDRVLLGVHCLERIYCILIPHVVNRCLRVWLLYSYFVLSLPGLPWFARVLLLGCETKVILPWLLFEVLILVGRLRWLNAAFEVAWVVKGLRPLLLELGTRELRLLLDHDDVPLLDLAFHRI